MAKMIPITEHSQHFLREMKKTLHPRVLRWLAWLNVDQLDLSLHTHHARKCRLVQCAL